MKLRSMSVTEVNGLIRRTIESIPIFNSISVYGQVTNLVIHSSGHCYFSLKDENSKIPCIMFKADYIHNGIELDEGAKIQGVGKLTVYEKDGKYQYYLTSFSNMGIGELHMEFLKSKKMLEDKGYFDTSRKRKIENIKKAALITSTSGAVLSDMLRISKLRSPLTNFVIIPTSVQGDMAPNSIISSINKANTLKDVDVIVLARGGGSLEDLKAFNDIHVADAIFMSKIPIISAIGHETDFTIADFVADLRASTPSNAAEIITNDSKNILDNLDSLKYSLFYGIQSKLSKSRNDLNTLAPQRFEFRIKHKLANLENEVSEVSRTMNHAATLKISKYKNELGLCRATLVNINPLSIMEKGYSLVKNNKNRTLSSINSIIIGDDIDIHMIDGKFTATVKSIEKGDEYES